MAATKRRYSKEEIVKRGEAIFEKDVRPHLKGRNPLDYVLIDIETGEYEVDVDHMTAHRRLCDRIPDAQIWARRVGSRHLHHLLSPRLKGNR